MENKMDNNMEVGILTRFIGIVEVAAQQIIGFGGRDCRGGILATLHGTLVVLLAGLRYM